MIRYISSTLTINYKHLNPKFGWLILLKVNLVRVVFQNILNSFYIILNRKLSIICNYLSGNVKKKRTFWENKQKHGEIPQKRLPRQRPLKQGTTSSFFISKTAPFNFCFPSSSPLAVTFSFIFFVYL